MGQGALSPAAASRGIFVDERDDSSLTPLRRLAAAEVLAERLADLRAHADRAFAAITQDQTDTAAVLAAVAEADLPPRVKEQVLAKAREWKPAAPTGAD